jgi:hypothetical protein
MTFWDFLEFSGIARQIAVVQPLRAVTRRQLAYARRPQRSEAQFLTGFRPMMSWRCGKIVFLTFKLQRVMVAAGEGGLPSSRLSDGNRL